MKDIKKDINKINIPKLKDWIEGLLEILCEETNIHKVSWYLFSTEKGDVKAEYSHDLRFPGYPPNRLRVYLGEKEVKGKATLVVALGSLGSRLNLKGKFSADNDEDDMQRIRDLSSVIHAKRKEAGIRLRQPLGGVTL